jgi:hypothetical protein
MLAQQIRLVITSNRTCTITRSPAQNVQLAAMVKINLRLQATVGQLVNQVDVAQGAAAAANATARQAQVAAQAAGNADRFTWACGAFKAWEQEEGRACGPVAPSHRRLSSNCSQRGLYPVGIFLFEGWS